MALQGVCSWPCTAQEGRSESNIVRRAMAVEIQGQLQGDNMIRLLLTLRPILRVEDTFENLVLTAHRAASDWVIEQTCDKLQCLTIERSSLCKPFYVQMASSCKCLVSRSCDTIVSAHSVFGRNRDTTVLTCTWNCLVVIRALQPRIQVSVYFNARIRASVNCPRT